MDFAFVARSSIKSVGAALVPREASARYSLRSLARVKGTRGRSIIAALRHLKDDRDMSDVKPGHADFARPRGALERSQARTRGSNPNAKGPGSIEPASQQRGDTTAGARNHIGSDGCDSFRPRVGPALAKEGRDLAGLVGLQSVESRSDHRRLRRRSRVSLHDVRYLDGVGLRLVGVDAGA